MSATDQQKPMTKKYQDMTAPESSRSAIRILATTAMVVALLGLSAITLSGTVIALVLMTPLVVIFFPILAPAGGLLFVTTVGFLFSGGCGLAALGALLWTYNYVAGKHPPGSDKIDYARMKISNTARDVKDKAKEYGRQVQQKSEDQVPNNNNNNNNNNNQTS